MSILNLWEKHFGLCRREREEMPAYVPKDVSPYFYWDGSGQSHLKQRDFLRVADALLPNPKIVLFVFPHIAEGVPVPGYATGFSLYEKDHYALPAEYF